LPTRRGGWESRSGSSAAVSAALHGSRLAGIAPSARSNTPAILSTHANARGDPMNAMGPPRSSSGGFALPSIRGLQPVSRSLNCYSTARARVSRPLTYPSSTSIGSPELLRPHWAPPSARGDAISPPVVADGRLLPRLTRRYGHLPAQLPLPLVTHGWSPHLSWPVQAHAPHGLLIWQRVGCASIARPQRQSIDFLPLPLTRHSSRGNKVAGLPSFAHATAASGAARSPLCF
jgi:hypothetical protein